MLILTKKEKFADLRRAADFTQRSLALELETRFGRSVSPQTIAAWEAGRWPPNLTPRETGILCEVLKVDLHQLIEAFGEEDERA